MFDRPGIAQQAAAKLHAFASRRHDFPVVIGFDGFVDSIISVVDKRHDADRFDTLLTIDAFGQKILRAAGQSTNFELVVKREKLGGNGPIMANALASFGLPVTYIGALGRPTIHSVFAPLVARAECHSLAEPGKTDSLEFVDGKLMLGKLDALKNVGWQTLCDVVGETQFSQVLRRSHLVGMLNWSLLPNVVEIWQQLAERLLPAQPTEDRRIIFIDLSDPEKRSAEDLRQALDYCTFFENYANVILGLNLKEAIQVAEALGITSRDTADAAIERLACSMRRALSIHGVVIHPTLCATASFAECAEESSGWFAGPRISEPKILTGGGDHFNAGFCLARLAGLSPAESLCCGTATSGYYVSHAISPTLEELIEFIENLPEPPA